jgi:clan AA aspartic protease
VITGHVFHRQPTVFLTIYDPSGQHDDVEAIVDTGFTGYLTLPQDDVVALALPFVSYYNAGLADGSRVRLDVHEATVLWHGVQQTVLVLATGYEPLMGMSLIYGSRLTLEGVDGGTVILEELP